MEEKSRGRKLWEHIVSCMRIQNKNPGCSACASPILDKDGKPAMPQEHQKSQ